MTLLSADRMRLLLTAELAQRRAVQESSFDPLRLLMDPDVTGLVEHPEFFAQC